MTTIQYSVEDWQLFSDMDGNEQCAARLNAGASKLLSDVQARSKVNPFLVRNVIGTQAFRQFQNEYLDADENVRFGSGDTEPRCEAIELFERELLCVIDY